MNLPNAITIARILSVPVLIWLIVAGQYLLAFWLFVFAGLSDGVDGYIAKRFDQRTELGAYLDPIADKLMLVSIYVSLGLLRVLPPWLVILVVTRDIMIVGGVLLATLLEQPVKVKPLLISKLNTAAQIILAGLVLAVLGFGLPSRELVLIGSVIVAALTIVSGTQYVTTWIRSMASSAPPRQGLGE
ncbi:MAG TPA: CDP-alcohol phosphatidyltransferase family protein [Aestuariivirgaceae bacterium]|jgi:cardiolipin synthase